MTARAERRAIGGVLAFAALVRIGVCLARPELLAADPDGYAALAENLRTGNGFVLHETGGPTAYRPPLYPLLLVPFLASLGRIAGVAVANVLCGLATVAATWWLGRRLGLGAAAVLAAGLVAVDPLLVLYTAHPMTEVPFTLLTTLLLLAIHAARSRGGWRSSTAVGLVFGLAALCRPTIWAWGGLAIVAACVAHLRRAERRLRWSALVAGAALVLLPWCVRNAVVLGRPIVTTTHGGYTLLLANNATFDAEVVRRPWGTVWAGASLTRWQASLESEMAAAEPPVRGELARDRWMRGRALEFIRREPAAFARGSWFRVRRFWNPVPLTSSLPAGVLWGVTVFNVAVFVAAAVGLARLRRAERPAWWPALLLVLSLTIVHTVYWSNARMRAPLVPLLALLAARSIATPRVGEVGQSRKGAG